MGFTASLPSLSDFVANLEATKWFKRPVEILDSQVTPDKAAGDLVRFSIKGAVNDPEAPLPVPAAAGRGRGGRGRQEVREALGRTVGLRERAFWLARCRTGRHR